VARWLTAEEQTLWRAWLATSAELARAIEDDLLEHGLSPADYEILAHLSESADGQLRMTELAGAILVSKSRLTYRVAQLEERGLVERRASEDDGRGVTAVLTRTGRKAIERAAPGHVETVRAALIDHIRPSTRRALTADLCALLRARHREPHGHGPA
jgi:DNA-binding MarR family transcriptional regulator